MIAGARRTRLENALEEARAGRMVAVYPDPRRRVVPMLLAVFFFALGLYELRAHSDFERSLSIISELAALYLFWAWLYLRGRAHVPLITFDKRGVSYRDGKGEARFEWSDLQSAYAAPAARRFVVLLLPRAPVVPGSRVMLPPTSEFRANELLRIIRIYAGVPDDNVARTT